MGVPQNALFIRENPTKMDDDWGYPDDDWKPPYGIYYELLDPKASFFQVLQTTNHNILQAEQVLRLAETNKTFTGNSTYPLAISHSYSAIGNGPFIVYIPIENGDVPQLCKRLPEGNIEK